MIDVAVGQAIGPGQVIDILDALQVHRQAFDAVGDFAGDRLAVDAADLLEIGELRHLHAVHPDLPAQTPGTKRRVLPVVLDETYVVLLEVEAERFEGAEIQLQNIVRRRLQHHLILVVMLHAIRVLAVATVLGAARRLHVGGLPRLRADGAQEGGGVAGAGADFHVVGLQQGAALFAPVLLQAKNDLLKRGFLAGRHRTHSVSRKVLNFTSFWPFLAGTSHPADTRIDDAPVRSESAIPDMPEMRENHLIGLRPGRSDGFLNRWI